MLKNLFSLSFLKGYRTIAAAITAIGAGLVMLADGDVKGVESIALGLGLLGLRFQSEPTKAPVFNPPAA